MQDSLASSIFVCIYVYIYIYICMYIERLQNRLIQDLLASSICMCIYIYIDMCVYFYVYICSSHSVLQRVNSRSGNQINVYIYITCMSILVALTWSGSH